MNKDQAIKFKEWITEYVDLDVKVINNQIRIDCKNGYMPAMRSQLIDYRGKIYVIDKFIYEGALRSDTVIHGDRIAKYARLRLDNGVHRRTTNWLGVDDARLNIKNKEGALKKLDEIVAGPKQVWLRVIYRDGGLHLIDRYGDTLSPARTKGTTVDAVGLLTGVICKYIIKGYTDHRHVRNSVFDHPIKDSHLYEYCLLEEIK